MAGVSVVFTRQRGDLMMSYPIKLASARPGREPSNIGMAEIDSRQRQINVLLDRLQASVEKRYGYAIIVLLEKLLIQTQARFTAEERLLEQLESFDTEAPLREHRRLAEQLLQLREAARNYAVTREAVAFFKTQLADHADNFDHILAAHLERKDVHVPPALRPKLFAVRRFDQASPH